MPKLSDRPPSYRRHKASGQAIVTIAGKDHYLGPWKSKASQLEYDRLIGEWLAAGRPTAVAPLANDLTVTELCAAYWKFAQHHYRKPTGTTGEIHGVKSVLKRLRRLYGPTLAVEFGPLALKALRNGMIADGLSRSTVNQHVGRIRRIFRWAVSEELLPVQVHQALATVAGLRKGRGEAREGDPVMPVADATVEATLPYLPPVVADMVRLQRLTGARPGEVCLIRPGDVDTTGEVWTYRPQTHKNEHRGRERIIHIGPKGQDVLRTYLLRPADGYCFSPAESEHDRRKKVHEQRKTPLIYGNRPGTNRKRNPKRSAGMRYDVNGYRKAIERACEVAFGMPNELRKAAKDGTPDQRHERLRLAREWRKANCWAPNQLRHTAATEIRKQYGLEAAQLTLGHSFADVTQLYAERDSAKAAAIMRQVG